MMIIRWAFRLALLVVLIVIVYLSIKPFPVNAGHLPTNDKIGHFLAYLTLAFVGLNCFLERRSQGIFLLLALVLGATMEIAQSYIPGRESGWLDMLANAMGVVLAIPVFMSSRVVLRYFSAERLSG